MITVRPTHASRTRNLVAPHADKLAIGLTFTEGSGTAIGNIVTQLNLTDLGATSATGASCSVTSATGGFNARMVGKFLRVTAGTNWLAGTYRITAFTDTNTITVAGPVGSSATLSAGTGSGKVQETGRADNTLWAAAVGGTGESWSGETLTLAATNTLSLTTAAHGASLGYYRYTILIERTFSDLSSPRMLFRGPATSTTNGFRGIFVSTTGVTFQQRAAGVDTSFSVAVAIANDDRVLVALQGRKTDAKRRLVVSVNGGTPVYSAWTALSSYTLICANGSAFTFNEDDGTVAAGVIYGFYWWDWVLDDEDLDEYFVDPSLAARPLLDADLVDGRVGPVVGRPVWSEASEFYCSFMLTGAANMTLGGTAERYEVRFYTDRYCTSLIGPGMTIEHTFNAATDEGQPIIMGMGDVHAMFTKIYWKLFTSEDGGSTWRPGPAPRGVLYTGDDGEILSYADGHPGDDAWIGPESGYDLGIPSNVNHDQRTEDRARNAVSVKDLRKYALRNNVSLIVDLGDNLYAPNATGDGYKNLVNPIAALAGPRLWVPGNHESLFPFLESVTDAEYGDRDFARRREALVNWRRFTLNPLPDTYDAISDAFDWSENEGDPAEFTDDETAWNPLIEWHQSQSAGVIGDGPETYAEDFLLVSTGGTWAENLGLNTGPRGNYGAIPMPLSKTLVVWLDVTGYAVGDSLDNHSNVKASPWGRLGRVQRAWLVQVLAWGKANGYDILVFAHNCPDGRGLGTTGELSYYGRGMFLNADHPEDAWLIEQLQNAGVRFFAHGHDHGGGKGRMHGITHVACPSFGNQFRFTQSSGPELGTADVLLDYGKASINGADQEGMECHWCQWGYLIYNQQAKTLTFRQTYVDLLHARYFLGLSSTTPFVGRYVGEAVTTDSAGNITVEEIPTQVYCAVAADDGDFAAHPTDAAVLTAANYATWQNYDAGNQAWYDEGHTGAEHHHLEQPFDAAVINCGSLVEASVRVCHAPRMLGTYAVEAAAAPATSGGGARGFVPRARIG